MKRQFYEQSPEVKEKVCLLSDREHATLHLQDISIFNLCSFSKFVNSSISIFKLNYEPKKTQGIKNEIQMSRKKS
jgi:hypothetical protein